MQLLVSMRDETSEAICTHSSPFLTLDLLHSSCVEVSSGQSAHSTVLAEFKLEMFTDKAHVCVRNSVAL